MELSEESGAVEQRVSHSDAMLMRMWLSAVPSRGGKRLASVGILRHLSMDPLSEHARSRFLVASGRILFANILL